MWTLFGVAFLVNPQLFGCSSGSADEPFTYSEGDMRAHVLGEWRGTAELEGESVVFTLTLKQAPATPVAEDEAAPPLRPQCGSRSFVQPAGACLSISTMALKGTLTSDSPLLTGEVTGTAYAYRILSPSELELELGDTLRFSGDLGSEGLSDGGIFAKGGGPLGSFTLARP